MIGSSRIEWTDATWNPVRGCSRVSEGCRNCYAERFAARFSRKRSYLIRPSAERSAEGAGVREPGPFSRFATMDSVGPRWTGLVELIPKKLDEPLHWRKPRRVFVNSMSDLFHESLPDSAIEDVFVRMAIADWHTYQVLTKRPQRMHDFLVGQDWIRVGREVATRSYHAGKRAIARHESGGRIFGHVWLGVSVEDQATADERIPLLLQTPAAVRFVSYEPALGPVDFTKIDGRILNQEYRGITLDVLHGGGTKCAPPSPWGVDWLIVGGESGPRARPFNIAWARAAIAQCRAAGVPVFVKQLGSRPESNCDEGPAWGQLYHDSRCTKPTGVWGWVGRCDRKGGDPAEWPQDLRVREFPS